MSMHDNQMPKGWHLIKTVLLEEMKTAKSFHLCILCADALFHARLLGRQVARNTEMRQQDECVPTTEEVG